MKTHHEQLAARRHHYTKRGLPIWLIIALCLTFWTHPATASAMDPNALSCSRVDSRRI